MAFRLCCNLTRSFYKLKLSAGSRDYLRCTATRMMSVDEKFRQAKDSVGKLTQDPGNDAKLKMYALFKQGTIGQCNTPKPGAFDFVGKVKWTAWNVLGDISQEDAQKQYIELVDSLIAMESPGSEQEISEKSTDSGNFEHITVKREGALNTILLNRPSKYNALNHQMYQEIITALEQAGEDDSSVTLLTGAGQYFCSGNDLSNFLKIPPEGPQKLAAQGKELLRKFVSSFIDFPKPIVAAVNGPAIGVSVTLLGLVDIVYASDAATFHTPFMSLGQSPEACSSYLFPKIMGQAKAHEVLLAGRKLSAAEACDYGLVTQVFPQDEFGKEVEKRTKHLASLPPKSLCLSKQLCRSVEKAVLHNVNEKECELLEQRWLSDECAEAVMKFMQRKAKM